MSYGPTKLQTMFSEEYLEDRLQFLLSKVEHRDGHWLFTGAGDGNGYGKLRVVMPDGAIWYPKAHALSYLLHVGDLESRMDVCHTCDQRRCINPEHLYLGTRTQNLVDACVARTSRHHGKPPRLLDNQVLELRALRATGKFKLRELAERFGIDHQAASRISRGLSYKWVN